MKIQPQDHPGHFCDASACHFFLHLDIVPDDATDNSLTTFCISAIGEYGVGWNCLNASGKTYEIMVFDERNRETRWSEKEAFLTNDKNECIRMVYQLASKYLLYGEGDKDCGCAHYNRKATDTTAASHDEA